MRSIVVLAAALAATPATAQPAPPAASIAAEAPDPARLAAARTTVDHVWPVGTYERMMRSSMDEMIDAIMASMFEMRLADIDGGKGPDGRTLSAERANMTLRESMASLDPHFQERMRIMNRVMAAEMLPMLNRIEPEIRQALALAYVRRFSLAQLAEMNAFFATPTGEEYARESMAMWAAPEMAGPIGRLTPELMKEMPRIREKVRAATAHLPLPPAAPPPR